MKKGDLRNFAKFTGKLLCQSLFINKVVGLKPATLLKKRLWHRCFPVNFAKFLRTPFFTEDLWWLLLDFKAFLLNNRSTTNMIKLIFKTRQEHNEELNKRFTLTSRSM